MNSWVLARKTVRLLPATLLVLVTGCSKTPEIPLQEVESFGSNPGKLRMFKYLPDSQKIDAQVKPAPPASGRDQNAGGERSPVHKVPLVVALHGCMQDAAGYGEASGWAGLADRWGFLLLLPEQRLRNNPMRCFSWYSPADHQRDVGEALSIRQMVERMRRDHAIDQQRIYVTGISAGGAMTVALAAVYPEIFAGAAPLAGVPFGCADGLFSGLSCMRDPPDKEAVDWGGAVRTATHHKGPWPRISVWQGEADSAVDPANAIAIVRQWTNVHGVGLTPELDNEQAGHLHTRYRDKQRQTLVESYRIKGMGHGVPVDPGPGEDQCGKEGRYFLDVDLCASIQIAKYWRLYGAY